MPVKIDNFTFDDQTIKNFDRVGITPQNIEDWIADGRANEISDTGIKAFITDKFHELNAENEVGIKDAARFVLSKTPFIGEWVDEAEAIARSGKSSGQEYEKYLQRSRESISKAEKSFKRNTEQGNWFDRNIGRYAPTALNMAENSLAAILTGGATLVPGVSSLQGAIEGAGAGENATQRVLGASGGGAIGYAVPAILNKIMPTKSVTTKVVNKAASKSIQGASNPTEVIIAKAIKTGEEPVSVIAKESTRATRPAIFKNLQQGLKGNDAQSRVIYDSAVRNVDYQGGFVQYIKDRMPKGLSSKVSDRLTKGFNALQNTFEEIGAEGDLLVKENLPDMIDGVINMAMRGAKDIERKAVKDAAIKAFADRSISKEITKKAIPQNIIGQLGNQISSIKPTRIITRPLGNILNAGTLKTLQGKGILGTGSDVSRGALDAFLEDTILQ